MSVDFVQRLVERVRGTQSILRPAAGSAISALGAPMSATDVQVEFEEANSVALAEDRPPTADPMRLVEPSLVPARRPEQRSWDGEMVQPAQPGKPIKVVETARHAKAGAPTQETELGSPTRLDTVTRSPGMARARAGRQRDLAEGLSRRGTVSPKAMTESEGFSPVGGAMTEIRTFGSGDTRTALSRQQVEAAPVIRVHIGRVDVRSSAPPAAAAPNRPREPLPSVALNQYLEQRSRPAGKQ